MLEELVTSSVHAFPHLDPTPPAWECLASAHGPNIPPLLESAPVQPLLVTAAQASHWGQSACHSTEKSNHHMLMALQPPLGAQITLAGRKADCLASPFVLALKQSIIYSDFSEMACVIKEPRAGAPPMRGESQQWNRAGSHVRSSKALRFWVSQPEGEGMQQD